VTSRGGSPGRVSTDARGSTARVNPRRASSCRRFSAWGTPRTSPPSPTSPKNAQWGSTGAFRTLDKTAANTPRSAAGSRISTRPRRSEKRPRSPGGTSILLQHRQEHRDSLEVQPVGDAPRNGCAGGESPAPEAQRIAESLQGRHHDAPRGMWRSLGQERAEGCRRGPGHGISKTPISSVGPKRFCCPQNRWLC
jgi:hypothetical protein